VVDSENYACPFFIFELVSGNAVPRHPYNKKEEKHEWYFTRGEGNAGSILNRFLNDGLFFRIGATRERRSCNE
jgi:hypothetical protein